MRQDMQHLTLGEAREMFLDHSDLVENPPPQASSIRRR
jgi:hypothetical protein